MPSCQHVSPITTNLSICDTAARFTVFTDTVFCSLERGRTIYSLSHWFNIQHCWTCIMMIVSLPLSKLTTGESVTVFNVWNCSDTCWHLMGGQRLSRGGWWGGGGGEGSPWYESPVWPVELRLFSIFKNFINPNSCGRYSSRVTITKYYIIV